MEKGNPLIISDEERLYTGDAWGKGKKYRDFVINKVNNANPDKMTRLSDVLPELPYGIVYKDETGMGATTLELKSKRNSIIVEPIKITASSKAFEHQALYVGSPTTYHPDKVEIEDIFNYLENPKIKFKKIIVVADSLGRVINAILMAKERELAISHIRLGVEKINAMTAFSPEKKLELISKLDTLKDPKKLGSYYDKSELNKFFLLIDEIDSFQLDSSYRLSMEDCIEYYKMFQKERRCMLSATDIRFTDPELSKEPITFIRYSVPTQRKINIITTSSQQLLGIAYDRIVDTLKMFPKDKILVAFNSVKGCYNLAEPLRINNIIKKDQISILCSIQNKEMVNDYFIELESDKLPNRLNFITSAYFTGFDLLESFHLVSISGNRSNVQALSERRLKQIAGRCREGLKTETIIHDIAMGGVYKKGKKQEVSLLNGEILKNSGPDPTKDDLITAATEQVLAMNCMNNHYKRNKMLHEILEDINDRFMKILDEKQMRFVRRDINRNLAISYLNIDAKLEQLRVRKELYLSNDSLTQHLRKAGHNVNIVEKYKGTEIIESNFSYEDNDRRVREIIEILNETKNDQEISELLKGKNLSLIQKTIIRDYKNIYTNFNSHHILEKIEKSLVGKRDNRIYNSLIFSAQLQTLPNGHIVIDRLKYYFEIGKRYSAPQILKRMNQYLLEIGNVKELKKEREAVQMLNKFCTTYRKSDKTGGPVYRHIKNYNPENLECVKKKPDFEATEKLSLLGYLKT